MIQNQSVDLDKQTNGKISQFWHSHIFWQCHLRWILDGKEHLDSFCINYNARNQSQNNVFNGERENLQKISHLLHRKSFDNSSHFSLEVNLYCVGYFIKDELSELWVPDFGLFVQYGLGRCSLDGFAADLWLPRHWTLEQRLIKNVFSIGATRSQSMETLLEPNQIVAQWSQRLDYTCNWTQCHDFHFRI